MKDQSVRVLLVEDSLVSQKWVLEALSQSSAPFYSEHHVETLAKALDEIGRKDVDVILLDLMLPDSDGFETFNMIRAAAPDLPIIVLSGEDDEALGVKAVQNGAQDYLVKGKVSRDLLLRSMRYAMERKRLEEELQEFHKMQVVGQLAGGIAHDFNNILASVIGYARLALDDVKNEKEVRESLEQVLKAGSRGKELIDKILAFTRRPSVEQHMGYHPLGDLVRETVKLLKHMVPPKTDLTVNIEPNLPLTKIDPNQIHQAIANICVNSFQAMPHGGRLQIQLKKVTLRETDDSHSNGRPDQQSLPAGEYLELSLEDTGCGMSKEVLSRIFEPFFTTRKFGSGMGLAASHGIIRSHGGDIRIRSEPKLGTSVKIYLPAAGNASAETLAEPASCPQLQGSESILVVDDEETVAAMIAKTLTRFGYRVTVHTSSTEALKAFQDSPEKWDLAVLDEIMPDLTGDRLAEQMSRIRPRFPIILCSGFSRIPSVEKMKEFGIRKFITKPILDDKLMREIRHLLDESKRDKPLSSVKA